MRATSKLLALALTAALQPAMAGVVSLNFETTAVGQLTNQYANSGVTFSGNAWDVRSTLGGCGGSWSFTGKNGSCGALLLGDPTKASTSDAFSFTIDVTAGFVDAIDFIYGVRGNSGVVIKVYDAVGGAAGVGNLLTTVNGLSGSACSDSDLRFCTWYDGRVGFSGTAYSVTISGVDKRLMLDDLRFTTVDGTPPTVPEPASIALALSALGALGWARKRSAR